MRVNFRGEFITRPELARGVGDFLYVISWVMVFSLLVFRQIPSPAALDDLNYINYFIISPIMPGGAVDFIFGEVVFKSGAYVLGGFIDPETGVRLLVALSVAPQMLVSMTLPRWGRWFFLLGYIAIGVLAMQLGFNQLRQGIALGVFTLAYLTKSRKWLLPWVAIFAGTIHTSALFIAGSWFVGGVAKRFFTVALLLLLLGVIFFSSYMNNAFLDVGGGRAEMYAASVDSLNLFGIIGNGFFVLLTFLSIAGNENKDEFFFRSYLIFSGVCFLMAVLPWSSAFAGRLFYYCRWMEIYQMGRWSKSRNSRMLAVAYLVFGFSMTMWMSYRSGGETYIGRVASLFI